MKQNKLVIIAFVLLIVLAGLYRLVPDRPLGFAPQFAMALFGGAIFSDKKLAFGLPLISMFISDLLYQVMFSMGIGNTPGFYAGQITNYVLFAGLTFFGFMLRDGKMLKSVIAFFAAPTAFFIFSNFFVWASGAGFARPKSLDGLMMTYADGIPFFKGSIAGTLVFSVVLFGAYFFIKNYVSKRNVQLS